MRIKKVYETKICIGCKTLCKRRETEYALLWSKRKYCSHDCHVKYNLDKISSRVNNPEVQAKSRLYLPIGEKHHNYKQDRYSIEPRTARKFWTKQIISRDGNKCKLENSKCKGKLETHHIISWRESKELRFDINNGITLCHAHHPHGKAEEKRLEPYLKELVSVSNSIT